MIAKDLRYLAIHFIRFFTALCSVQNDDILLSNYHFTRENCNLISIFFLIIKNLFKNLNYFWVQWLFKYLHFCLWLPRLIKMLILGNEIYVFCDIFVYLSIAIFLHFSRIYYIIKFWFIFIECNYISALIVFFIKIV